MCQRSLAGLVVACQASINQRVGRGPIEDAELAALDRRRIALFEWAEALIQMLHSDHHRK